MKFVGSKTEKNLLAAFAGESQARNRYSFFASVAKKEGYEQIAAIFEDTAANEREHAKLFFKQLKGGEVTITAGYPAGMIGTTKENLKAAPDGDRQMVEVLGAVLTDGLPAVDPRARSHAGGQPPRMLRLL